MKEFDYYIFIDYSENLIGYSIIKRANIKEILPKISRFRHYKKMWGRKLYLKHIKNTIKKEKIRTYFETLKFRHSLSGCLPSKPLINARGIWRAQEQV